MGAGVLDSNARCIGRVLGRVMKNDSRIVDDVDHMDGVDSGIRRRLSSLASYFSSAFPGGVA